MWIVSFEESGALSLSTVDQKSKEDIILLILCRIRCVSILVLVVCIHIASFLIELSQETLACICTFAPMHKICC